MRFALADNFYLQCPALLLPASFTMPFTCTAMAVSFTCNARIAMVLMSLLFYVSCSRWHCTVIEIRSLVLARDDVVVACLRCFVGVWECGGGCEGSWCLFWALGKEFLRARKFCCEGSEFAKRGFAR